MTARGPFQPRSQQRPHCSPAPHHPLKGAMAAPSGNALTQSNANDCIQHSPQPSGLWGPCPRPWPKEASTSEGKTTDPRPGARGTSRHLGCPMRVCWSQGLQVEG